MTVRGWDNTITVPDGFRQRLRRLRKEKGWSHDELVCQMAAVGKTGRQGTANAGLVLSNEVKLINHLFATPPFSGSASSWSTSRSVAPVTGITSVGSLVFDIRQSIEVIFCSWSNFLISHDFNDNTFLHLCIKSSKKPSIRLVSPPGFPMGWYPFFVILALYTNLGVTDGLLTIKGCNYNNKVEG